MTEIEAKDRLENTLHSFDKLAVAVSGGVDSMVLAFHAHETLGEKAAIFHAVSAAVPPEATSRVTSYAKKYGWALTLIDANEFEDENYVNNPVNRCFFCKTNLYETVARHTRWPIASGTNLDDLGDYRPGLIAAEASDVRHPFVEAEIDKTTVRALANLNGLTDLAELPAAPCLSSRITTGIAVTPERVGLVHDVENLLKETFGVLKTVRCRVQASGVEIQLEPNDLVKLDPMDKQRLETQIIELCRPHFIEPYVVFAPYTMGSAFLKDTLNVV